MEWGLSERVLVEYARKGSPPPFLLKTYMVLEDPATDHIISWNADGTAFVVWQPPEFARDLLPTLFKHSNFSSFIRQLNTYGFHKVAANRWEFSNKLFRRGQQDKLREIYRKKATYSKPQPRLQLTVAQKSDDHDELRSLSASSSSEAIEILICENKRLRRENGVLCSELSAMKNKFEELLDLAAVYGCGNSDRENITNSGPKIFGVRLGVWRGERKK